MFKILKSEFLKLKNSAILYLMIGLFALEWLSIPVYLSIHQTSYALEAMTFLPMLAYCLMLAIVSLLTMEQEEQANHCQNINSSHNRAKIWLLKLLARDLIVILPCLVLWASIGYVINDISYAFYSGSLTWLLLVFLNHFHHLLSLWVGRGVNLIIAFIECLFIIFASNKAFIGNFLVPVILPVNAILIPESRLILKTIFSLLVWTLVTDFITILTLKRNKNE
ncbi:ABC transporter permease [Streptococcus equinus]|uniref:ABC transporter permease n=1 Tax=Streptococcus equinus TaxID=1335 RepID=UPI000880E0F8|nr:ABC transporter permease [Streptococcus equinus]SDQ15780.1 ABC-2 type transport system permease protein [Streptococcus equinus]